jgi:transposase
VIALPAGARVLLATRPVDFRKGAHALAGMAAEVLDAEPFSGAVLVFRARWPAAGLVDTEIRFSNRIGGFHAATSVQPRVQA